MSNFCISYLELRLPPPVDSEFGFAIGSTNQNVDHSASLAPGSLPLVLVDAAGRRFHGAKVSANFRHGNVLAIPRYECPHCGKLECARDRCTSCGEFPCKHPGVKTDG